MDNDDTTPTPQRRRQVENVQDRIRSALRCVRRTQQETYTAGAGAPATPAGYDEHTDGLLKAMDQLEIAAKALDLARVLVRADS